MAILLLSAGLPVVVWPVIDTLHLLDFRLTGARGHTFCTKELHQKAYFEATDVIVSELQQRFEQPGFETYTRPDSIHSHFGAL